MLVVVIFIMVFSRECTRAYCFWVYAKYFS